MKLAIIGSRSFTDYNKLENIINKYFRNDDGSLRFDEIISGGAIGVDSLAENYAIKYNVRITVIKPDYDTFGRYKAPLIRNEKIVRQADIILAIWDGSSRGTANAIGHAKRLKKDSLVIYF